MRTVSATILAIVGSLLLAGVMLTASAGSANAAGVPKGKGFDTFGPVNCPDLDGDVFVTGPSGGNAPAWLPDGTMVVLKSIDATFTVRDADENVVDSDAFSQSFGKKSGLGTAIQCTGQFEETEGDFTFTFEFTVDIVIVPRR